MSSGLTQMPLAGTRLLSGRNIEGVRAILEGGLPDTSLLHKPCTGVCSIFSLQASFDEGLLSIYYVRGVGLDCGDPAGEEKASCPLEVTRELGTSQARL